MSRVNRLVSFTAGDLVGNERRLADVTKAGLTISERQT
jgi:hypothetical protein